MAPLTPAQAELLTWIVESGSGEVLLVPLGNAAEDLAIILGGGPRQEINPTDFRELVAQGLIRHVREQLYETSNAGRVACEQLGVRPPSQP